MLMEVCGFLFNRRMVKCEEVNVSHTVRIGL